ncbi:Ras guanine nucleotide exchange factor bud5 [Coemansia sp. S100]|nr:Ras guanine nucleotide exchange factor bud5 [Coemansia sp. S100]KAJ2109729.1 Ras guanine nucleotide exchange factor bud5 [Coemansia sp. S142-1]
MAFYYNHGNQAERIQTQKDNPGSGIDEQLPLSPTFDDDSALPRPATSGGRRRIGETLRKGRTGAPRRDMRLAKIFGEPSTSTSDTDRTKPNKWRNERQQTIPVQPGPSIPNDILFNSEGRVSYGTWRGLVMYLTQVNHTADDFTHAFFLVFRAFATPNDFAEALVARARESPTTKMTPAETKTWNDRVQAPIRHNVFLAIKTWFESYWYSADDGMVLGYLCSFLLNEYLPTRHGSSAKECHKLLRKIESRTCTVDLKALADRHADRTSPALAPGVSMGDTSTHHDAQSNAPAVVVTPSQPSDSRSAPRQARQSQYTHTQPPSTLRGTGHLSTEEGAYLTQTVNAHRHGRPCRKGILHRLFHRSDHSANLSAEAPSTNPSLHAPFQLGNTGLEPIDDDEDEDSDDDQSRRSHLQLQTSVQDVRPTRAPSSDYESSDDGQDMPNEHKSGASEEPDISDLLMATVGMDLSLEAYRRTSHILQVSPADVACQLTIIESSCFCQIMPFELLNKEFSRGHCSHAVNVRQMTRWCTQITRWASLMILSGLTPERRCRVLKYFIQLGIQLLALKNYDAVMAVKAAIFCAAVMRLKQTWSLLPKKFNIMCKRLHEAMDPDHNYANYRAILRRSQPPLLPFLGLYLTDLTFLEDGNPTYRRYEEPDDCLRSTGVQDPGSRSISHNVDSQPPPRSQTVATSVAGIAEMPRERDAESRSSAVKLTGQTCALFALRESVDLNSRSILINFEKSYKVASIIMEIQKFQVEYSGNFTIAIPGLQQYLIEQWEKCEAEGYDDDKIYALSLKREPRAAACHETFDSGGIGSNINTAASTFNSSTNSNTSTTSRPNNAANHYSHQSMQAAMRLTRLLPGTQRLRPKEVASPNNEPFPL